MLTENPIANAHYRAIVHNGHYRITCPGIDRHHQFIRLLRRSQDCPCEGKTIFTLEAFGCHWQGSIRKLQGGEAALPYHYSLDHEVAHGSILNPREEYSLAEMLQEALLNQKAVETSFRLALGDHRFLVTMAPAPP